MPTEISRSEAKRRGLKRYFTGKPCPKGHRVERFVSSLGCAQCASENHAEWLKDNSEKNRRMQADWRVNNKGYQARWTTANPQKVRAIKQKWYIKNADDERARARQWQVNNPEKVRANVRNRCARRKAAVGSHTAAEILSMLNEQEWLCVACGACLRNARHIDHIIPLVRGGSNYIENLQGLCPTCNMRKSSMMPDEWAKERSGQAPT